MEKYDESKARELATRLAMTPLVYRFVQWGDYGPVMRHRNMEHLFRGLDEPARYKLIDKAKEILYARNNSRPD